MVHSALHGFLQFMQPLLVPLCFIAAWGLIGMTAWSLWAGTRDAVSNAKTMHEIPCANCQFFTNTHYLKCPVHPTSALSPDAINCPDYEAVRLMAMLEEDKI